MCKKFHYNQLRNDGALGKRKSDNNKNPNNKNNNKSNVRSHLGTRFRVQKNSVPIRYVTGKAVGDGEVKLSSSSRLALNVRLLLIT